MAPEKVLNYINNQWVESSTDNYQDVVDPATLDILGRTPLSSAKDVEKAAEAAQRALISWRRIPSVERVQYLFKLKAKLDEQFEDLSRTITMECGKTLDESRGEMKRAVENVEVACGIPQLMMGYNSEDIARGIDEMMIRQPVGVTAIISPFNFPGMIPFWFLPYAIACGNTVIVKPSERVPLTMQKVFHILDEINFPPGVVNMVNGGKDCVDAILDHPVIRAISFVGSTAVARYVYRRSAENGKRAQCQGGAKNPILVLPDADIEMATRIVADSAFGCAGQRCLAASLVITVGDANDPFSESISDAAAERVVGYGLTDGVQMGPVITQQSKGRIEEIIGLGKTEGAEVLVDGRGASIAGYERGHFIRPTVIRNIVPGSKIARTEIFGPVLGIMQANSIDEAIQLVNSGTYGNMASLFTSSGSAARKFRSEAEAGNIGINIGVAAPMAFFPFSGWKESFFGDLHGQGLDAIEFFTQKKVVVERWPKEWSRQF